MQLKSKVVHANNIIDTQCYGFDITCAGKKSAMSSVKPPNFRQKVRLFRAELGPIWTFFGQF